MDDESIRKTIRIVVEICVTITLVVSGLALNLVTSKSGFICHDPALSFPFYAKQTISVAVLAILCTIVPLVVVLLTELYKHFRQGKRNRRCYEIFNCQVPSIVVNLYIYLGIFWLGLGFTGLITSVSKGTVGRLRPHFFDECQPVMYGNSTCDDAFNQNRFIVDYECSRVMRSLVNVIAINQSFPSGHSSYIFYAMTWLAVYVGVKWKVRHVKIVKVLAQFLFVLIAWFVALSRLRDYWHHFVDVFAGSIIGVSMAVFVTQFAYKKFYVVKRKERMRNENIEYS